MKHYKKFILENNFINSLKYYIFDIDDNILQMQTPLHFQHLENGRWVNKDISTEEFAEIRKKYPSNYMDNNEWKADQNYAFIEFRDYGPRKEKAFIEDVKKSINDKKFGPSWDTFIKVLVDGKLFALVTTRGHEPHIMKEGVRYIIDNVLTIEQKAKMYENLQTFCKLFNFDLDNALDTYLNSCYFMGINSKAFLTEFGYSPTGSKLNQGKQDAINKFVTYVRSFAKKTKLPLKVGFSDDDVNFSNAAKELFMSMEKSLNFPENFYVFDTSNPNIEGGVKMKI